MTRNTYLEAGADFARATRDASRSAAISAGKEAAHRAKRRLMTEEPDPPPLVLEGANPRQRAAMFSTADELAQRERRDPPALRGWRRIAFSGPLPAGCRPICTLMPAAPTGRTIRLVADVAGRVRLAHGDGRLGTVVSVSEASAIAAGRIAMPGE
jgi:hypothetical protein